MNVRVVEIKKAPFSKVQYECEDCGKWVGASDWQTGIKISSHGTWGNKCIGSGKTYFGSEINEAVKEAVRAHLVSRGYSEYAEVA